MTYEALFRAYEYLTARGIPMPEDVKAELIRLGLPAVKALQEYDNSLHRIVSIYIMDLRTKPINEVMNFGIEFAGAIDAGLNEAWRLGMRENDVSEMDDEMQAIVDEYIASEREHIPDFAEYITTIALNAETLGEAINGVANRLAMWVGRYTDVSNNAVLYTADEKTKLIWVYGDTEHCDTCAALNGIVAYAREWDMFPFRPQNPPNDMLECGGWRCQCTLTPTDNRHTRDAVDRLQEIYDSLGAE